MKNFLLSLSIIFLIGNTAFAVPTLTQANTAPSIGDVMIMFAADTSVQEGSSGASVTWTFNSLAITANTSVSTCVPVASTPYASDFPTANIALESSGAYQYLNSTSTTLQQLGVAAGAQITHFTPAINFLTFPFTYNSVVSTSNFTGTHAQGTLAGSTITTGDAYGTVIINGRTYTDVLRLKVVQDIDYTYTGIGNLIYHTVSYIWYDGIHKTPVLEIVTNDVSGLTFAYDKQVIIGDFATGTDVITGINPLIELYPNPAHNTTNISIAVAREANILVNIYDNTGAKIQVNNFGHQSNAAIKESLDISSLSKGIYMVEVIADKTRSTKRLIVY